jgi:hypothetical protein
MNGRGEGQAHLHSRREILQLGVFELMQPGELDHIIGYLPDILPG